MAHQQHFSEILMQRYNDISQENTQLQLQIARQHDEIATLQSQLHRGGPSNFPPGNVSALQHQIHDLQSQLMIARERAATAETRLKDSNAKFNEAYGEQRRVVQGLERQLKELKPTFREGRGRRRGRGGLEKGKGRKGSPCGSQKQFDAEKRPSSMCGGFPEKPKQGCAAQFEEDDQDDEEPESLFIKAEASHHEPEIIIEDDQPTIKAEPGTEPITDVTTFLETIKRESTSTQARQKEVTPAIETRSHRSSSIVEVVSAATSERTPTPAVEITPTPDVVEDLDEDDIVIVSSSRARKGSAKIKIEDVEQPPRKTRKRQRRTEVEMITAGMAGSNIIDLEKESPRPQKKARRREDPNAELKENFEFKAITEHHDDGEISAFDSKEDLRDEVPELWSAIRKVHDEWNELKSDEWKSEFVEGEAGAEQCASEKLKGGESVWRDGTTGKFACEKCVAERRPCFAWTGEEFWLLPLHDEDRKEVPEEPCDLRYWVNA